MQSTRPTGVKIIAILTIIGGILLLLGGIGMVAIAPLLSQINVADNSNTSNSTISLNVNGTIVTIPKNALFVLGGFLGIFGGMLIVLGIASFVVAWGLLKGKGWSWIVTIIVTIISAVLNIISIVAGTIENVVGLIINGIVIYYLYTPKVKSYFGRTYSITR